MNEFLSRVRIVLVETSHPGNIGGAARAMKTMGLTKLHLVAPREFPCAEATARASGADDVLAAATVCDSLAEALQGCHVVIGTSARLRSLSWPELNPRECGERIAESVGAGEVALVFGREKSGLTNDELAQCRFLVHIPSNPAYQSLNLAAAVQVLSYEIATAFGYGGQPREIGDAGGAPATAEEIEGLFRHMEQALIEIEYLDPGNPRHLMQRLRRLFNRVELRHEEVNILRGMCRAAQRHAALAANKR
ncbi:MAG: RNA methyltransferase [Gammaproteobacteria bacterium]|nr:RNA methyltransferase [Gammaproteobacteria bacterium]MCP5135481.1 RNA methyltransferase [Gammaproteobacteria bacterium]